MSGATITTEQNYDETLQEALALLDALVGRGGFPVGEREKAMADALNNTWGEGMTVSEWADEAGRRLGVWTAADVREWVDRHGGNTSALARRLDVARNSLVGWQAHREQSSSARTIQRDVRAHMRTLDALQAWLARWGNEIPAPARDELEAVLRGGR